ncbi:hypothetical protein [Nocardia blacklockiae]|uniref:hypothetical protein n=1 Tax=Nocardia blacklockiae TaxID=480036 RepID=UPI0018931E90|nr:hypothetical protein [Nocardia blacklockiae]MBF6173596.1 hypothetical protein [Nocardia blacklockiae]
MLWIEALNTSFDAADLAQWPDAWPVVVDAIAEIIARDESIVRTDTGAAVILVARHGGDGELAVEAHQADTTELLVLSVYTVPITPRPDRASTAGTDHGLAADVAYTLRAILADLNRALADVRPHG